MQENVGLWKIKNMAHLLEVSRRMKKLGKGDVKSGVAQKSRMDF
jgi:hypothetical protein